MSKNDNAHSLRLVEAIRSVSGEEAAKQFAAAYPLSKAADITKKFAWASDACAFLDANYDDAALRALRRTCRCNDGRAISKKLLTYLRKTESIRAFVDAFNAKESFATLEYISDHELLFCYPECYCACVKRVPGNLSWTWCYCTLGNAEGIFSAVFGETVCVNLLESIKTGGDRCAIRVTW